MNFTIYYIKPDWLRRIAIIVCSIPAVILCAILGAIMGAVDGANEIIPDIKACWNYKD